MFPFVFRLLRLYRHLIVALHGHQLMQAVAFLTVIVVALVFLRNERLNFLNDILALRKLHRCPAVIADALALGAFCFTVNHAPNGGRLRCALLRSVPVGSTLV